MAEFIEKIAFREFPHSQDPKRASGPNLEQGFTSCTILIELYSLGVSGLEGSVDGRGIASSSPREFPPWLKPDRRFKRIYF